MEKYDERETRHHIELYYAIGQYDQKQSYIITAQAQFTLVLILNNKYEGKVQ